MSILTDNVITWADLVTICYNAITDTCCNIGNINNVPVRLRYDPDTPDTDYSALNVKSISNIGVSGSQSKWTATWSAKGTNLISKVDAATVSSEWNTFLTAAGIDTRSNKVIQAKDMSLAIGLYQQFLAFHVKPVYSTRKVYNTAEAQSLFQSMKYVTGVCTPKYTLTGINPDTNPDVTNIDIENIVKQAIVNPDVDWGMLDSINDPVITKSYLY